MVATSFVLLGFSGAGETATQGSFQDIVAHALGHLLWAQDGDGLISSLPSSAPLYEHAMATLALTEALRLSPHDADLRRATGRALAFSASCQLTGGLWPRHVGGHEPAPYVSAWMLMAAWSAEKTDIPTDSINLRAALAALRDEEAIRQSAGTAPALCSREALKAAIALARVLHGDDDLPAGTELPDDAEVVRQFLSGSDVESCLVDPAFWYLECALRKVRGDTEGLALLYERLESLVLWSSEGNGDLSGSWNPVGRWAEMGGRVYTSALHTLALQIYYRYGEVFPVYAASEMAQP